MATPPQRQPELDGIRGIAILVVLINHCVPLIQPTRFSQYVIRLLTPGWAGVELFFVLSGFLITGILLRTKEATNYFTSFYARRFLRIFPIYYATLSAILLLSIRSMGISSILPSSEIQRASYYFYLQNWPVFWTHGFFKYSILGHFWSLAVEEQFYVVWPVLMWLLPEVVLRLFCLVGPLLALAGRVVLVHQFGADFGVMNLTTSRIDGLLIGCFLALQLQRGRSHRAWCISALAIGGGLIAYIAVFHVSELSATGIYMHTLGVTGFALISGAFVGFSQLRPQFLTRILTTKWLMTFGKYSYGMYVYHIPLYLTVETATYAFGWPMQMPLQYALPYGAVLIALTFGISRTSFILFEERFLTMKGRFEPRLAEVATPNGSCGYTIVQPPSTTNAWPVVNVDASEAR
jgi:peptidoglycan/LPS O-acetylase OafA/YrhL